MRSGRPVNGHRMARFLKRAGESPRTIIAELQAAQSTKRKVPQSGCPKTRGAHPSDALVGANNLRKRGGQFARPDGHHLREPQRLHFGPSILQQHHAIGLPGPHVAQPLLRREPLQITGRFFKESPWSAGLRVLYDAAPQRAVELTRGRNEENYATQGIHGYLS